MLGELTEQSSGWKIAAFVLLAVVGLTCLHGLLYHLHAILVPFVLSGFLVLALQPSVEFLYDLLAGRRWPSRWCCCGPRRTLSASPTRVPSRRLSLGSDNGEDCGITAEVVEHVADGLCRFVAVSLVLWAMLVLVLFVVMLLCHGAIHMRDNWESYRMGIERVNNWQDSMIDAVSGEFHMTADMEKRLKEGYYGILTKTEEGVWELVNTVVSSVSEGLSSLVLLFLYVLFWLLTPLPTGGKAGALVRSYIYKKTTVSFFFGLCVALLFLSLGIDLAVLFGIISFFLNYVPEVGAFISMVVPIPVILLDGRLQHPILILVKAIIGQLVLKFLFSNILEVKLIERDREMSIHPVWVILGLSYFGFVWGPIGMLISVPMMALVKTAALSASTGQDGSIVGGAQVLLACIEGRKVAYGDLYSTSSPTPERDEERNR